VPVLTSFGGGTESSKLYSGVEVVVVDLGTVVVRCTPVERVDAADGGPALFDPPAHAPSTKTPATRTLVARFPTERTLRTAVRIRTMWKRLSGEPPTIG